MKKHSSKKIAININREDALKLMDEHKMPDNIMQHSLAVNKVSLWLADRLIAAGERIEREVVDIASLLHDIDKIYSIHNGDLHGVKAYEILRDKDKKIADIVRKHVPSAMLNGELHTWEEKIIFYADKRVNSEKIVSLEERFEYLSERYESIRNVLETFMETTRLLEKELFTRIKADPSEIQKLQ